MYRIKEQKAITLIALIITIIVMLILVGVTVSVSLNGGLFNTAKQATNKTQIAGEKEQLFAAAIGAMREDGEVDFTKLDNNLPEGFTKVEEKIYESNVSGKTYIVSKQGGIQEEGPLKLRVKLSNIKPLTLLITWEIPELTEQTITDEQTKQILAETYGITEEVESYEELYLKIGQVFTENEELTYEELLAATGKEEPTTQDVFKYLVGQAGVEGIDTPQQAAILLLQDGAAPINPQLLINNETLGYLDGSKLYIDYMDESKAFIAIDEYRKCEISLELFGIKDEISIEVDGELLAEKLNWDSSKVNVRMEGERHSRIYIPIPKGFEVSTETTEDEVSEGLVIKDGENEFVWIPVENASEYTEDSFGPLTGTYGNDWEYDSYKTIQYWYGTSLGEINSETGFSTTFSYSTDKDNIERSIRKYGGFYVGRYETTYDNLDVNGVPQRIGVKQNKNVLSAYNILQTGINPNVEDPYHYRWWGLYKVQKDIYANNSNVGSMMISSKQWDEIMTFTNYGNTSRPYQSYTNLSEPDKSGTAYSTNANQYDEAKNIYDLAGNLYEITTGSKDNSYRIQRGGASDISGGLASDSGISFIDTDYSYIRFSFHTLYKVDLIMNLN